jgi:hypothetical protein
LIIFPENSTRVFTQHLIKVFETFDGISQRQVTAFLRVTPASISVSESIDSTDSLASIHKNTDGLIAALVQKKRMVRREPSFNALAPTDISELTSLMKNLRVPLQGLGLSRAMEENMRKAEKTVFADMEKEVNDEQVIPPVISQHENKRPRSYYGGTDDEEGEESDEGINTEDNDLSTATLRRFAPSSTANSSTTSIASSEATTNSSSNCARRRKIRWDDSMKVMTYWRQDYDDVLNIVKPTYLELTEACSTAVKESVKRLRRMQNLDPRYQDKPFFYKYYYRWKVGAEYQEEEKLEFEYHRLSDPSVKLFEAMQIFHEHRLVGLEKLYTKSGVPRRILFLLLTFQFNLHSYAESIYTLTSLIYELDQIRLKRRFWWPHITLRKWLFQSHKTDESYDLDTPHAIATTTDPLALQKTLTRRATLRRICETTADQIDDIEKNQRVLYRLDTPHRGEAHSPKEHHHRHTDRTQKPSDYINPWRRNTLDPLDYHDPDVAYPTTATQRFFYRVYMFSLKNLYTSDAAFSLRAAVVVACLSLPGWIEESCRWYNDARGQWAVVVALIWMGPSVGSNFFG